MRAVGIFIVTSSKINDLNPALPVGVGHIATGGFFAAKDLAVVNARELPSAMQGLWQISRAGA